MKDILRVVNIADEICMHTVNMAHSVVHTRDREVNKELHNL